MTGATRTGATFPGVSGSLPASMRSAFEDRLGRYAILIILTAIAGAVRLFMLGSDPVALNQDEVVNGYDAYSLLLTHRDHHGHSWPVMLESFGDWASPLVTYLTVPAIRLFGLTAFAVRLPVALLGTATIPLLYLLTKRLYGRNDVALLAAALCAVAPWSITISRLALPPSTVPFFALLFALVLLWATDALARRGWQSYGRLPIAALAAAALTYAYPTQKLFVPLMLAAAAVIFFLSYRRHALVLFATYALLVAPIVIPTVHDPQLYNERFASVALGGGPLHIVVGFIVRYLITLSPVSLFGSGDHDVQVHVPGFGENYAALAVFFYFAVGVTVLGLFRRTVPTPQLTMSRKSSLFAIAWLALFAVPASLTASHIHALRDVHGFPFVVIFCAAGVVNMLDTLKNSARRIALLALAVVMLFSLADFGVYYFTDYRAAGKEAFQYGLREVFTYIVPRQDGYRSIIVDDSINQPYIYYLFYGKIDPRTLSQADLDTRSHPPLGVGSLRRDLRIGKYRFEAVDPKQASRARLVTRIRDRWRVWFDILETPDNTLIVRRVPPPNVEPMGAEHRGLL